MATSNSFDDNIFEEEENDYFYSDFFDDEDFFNYESGSDLSDADNSIRKLNEDRLLRVNQASQMYYQIQMKILMLETHLVTLENLILKSIKKIRTAKFQKINERHISQDQRHGIISN